MLSPNVFLAAFPPGFSAPAHAHPYDTTYYVIEGAIRCGDEGWVKANSVRAVQAGHVYGPEEAHPVVGVTFLLVSSGPIDIEWADQ
jgi:mannose-6-phosphate isomerase-like protein (cupin superfamily)